MTTPQWWKDAVCYQVYPRSFADSNDDGIGDLPGLIDKLDYLQWLGITAIWISPFFPSPQFDVGYDVANYRDVDSDYGTLADFDRLLTEAHQRDIRILLDLVLNHTSDQHQWFKDSRSAVDNPYHNWYVWREGQDGGPPNDWESLFGGSAWEYDETIGKYYYHYFFKEQPDLNWRNPEVKQRMFDEVRFWLDRGVDGFRLDAIGAIYEDPNLTNSNVDVGLEELFLNWTLGVLEGTTEQFRAKIRYQDDLLENHGVMQELRALIDEYDDRVLLGETDDVKYYGNGQNELHSVFNFDILRFDSKQNLNAINIRQKLVDRQPRVPSGVWECNTLGNHDRTRSFTFYGHNRARYEVALAMLMFLRGTPVIYNGEEIGMSDLLMPDLETFRDNFGVWIYHILQEKRKFDHPEALHYGNAMGRDKCRTPMQWEDAPNAGFASENTVTWLPVNQNYSEGINVAAQRTDDTSILHYLRTLIQIRQSHDALRHGEIDLLDTGNVLSFWRRNDVHQYLVALNMSDGAQTLALSSAQIHLIFSNNKDRPNKADNLAELVLDPYEVYVGMIQ